MNPLTKDDILWAGLLARHKKEYFDTKEDRRQCIGNIAGAIFIVGVIFLLCCFAGAMQP